jgi:poly [ADP-ribose] polymerase
MKGPFSSIDAAAKEFTKKFNDKTKNKWENRDKFVPVPGKYTLIEMDDDSEGEEVGKARENEGIYQRYLKF